MTAVSCTHTHTLTHTLSLAHARPVCKPGPLQGSLRQTVTFCIITSQQQNFPLSRYFGRPCSLLLSIIPLLSLLRVCACKGDLLFPNSSSSPAVYSLLTAEEAPRGQLGARCSCGEGGCSKCIRMRKTRCHHSRQCPMQKKNPQPKKPQKTPNHKQPQSDQGKSQVVQQNWY